jgi:uroporphyrinogen-III synthase
LRAAGWQVHAWPALRIEPLAVAPQDIPLPDDFDLAVFVSGNAAGRYLEQLQSLGVADWPSSCVAAAVGPATAARLRASGRLGPQCAIVHPAEDAPRHDSEALWECLTARGPIPRRVLLVRGTEGRDWLAERLAGDGATVRLHAVYRRVPAVWDADARALLAQWASAAHHPAWLLTSGEGIDAVRANVAGADAMAWWQACRFIVTHPRLVDRLGLPPGFARHAVQVCAPAEDAIFNAFVSA